MFPRKMLPRAVVLLGLSLFCSLAAWGVVIDRIAATVDREVITLSQVEQIVKLRIVPREGSQSEEDHRRQILNQLIAQALRYRDVQRFGAEEVPADSIEARFSEVVKRFDSQAAFDKSLRETEMTADEVRGILKRQMQVESYIEERFSPLIFVSLEEIEAYYRDVWAPQRRERGLALVSLAEASNEIRAALKGTRLQSEVEVWTAELRSRANVDVYLSR